MTNHIHHLLRTPQEKHLVVSKMMEAIGRHYVRYFNHKYKRTGALLEGRFKSTLVWNNLEAIQLNSTAN